MLTYVYTSRSQGNSLKVYLVVHKQAGHLHTCESTLQNARACAVQEMLLLEGATEQEQVGAVEEDLLMLFEAWHRLCDPYMPFHVRNKDSDVSITKVEELPHD